MEARQEFVELSECIKSWIAKAEDEHRELTATETAVVNAAMVRCNELERQIEASDPTYVRTTGRKTSPSPTQGGQANFESEPQNLRLLQSKPFQGRSYTELFGRFTKSDQPRWKSLGEFTRTVADGLHDERLIRGAAMTEGVGSDGGFLVPAQYASMLLDKSLMMEVVRPRAMVSPMSSNSKVIASFDFLDGAAPGGFVFQWVGESNAWSEQKGRLKPHHLRAHKGGILARVSTELAEDGMEFDTQITNALTNSLAYGMDNAFLRGTGVGMPLGVLNAASLISVAKEIGQVADTLVYRNIVKMYARMHPSCIANSVWVVSPTVIPSLLTLQLPMQNVAGTDNVAGSHIAVTPGPEGSLMLLNRPLLTSDKLPPLGDKGDILFVDFSQYVIGLRREVFVERSPHVYFVTDELAVRIKTRIDGQPLWDAVYTGVDGNTLSWAVTLDDRP